MLASEPHHHLVLENQYVKVYQVEVAPGDSVKLHRHDTDAISLSLGESLVTVHSPGKPDAQQKLTNGQIRLQALGLVHSTSVEGDTPFRNVTVELLLPQTGKQNRCARAMANEPEHCVISSGVAAVPQFETDQTDVGLVRLPTHQRVVLGGPGRATLIVAVDSGAIQGAGASSLRAGNFVWLGAGKTAAFQNDSGEEVRLVSFGFKPKPGEGGATK
jgi:quercetin dioxygenase-like cupin family protein